MGGGGCSKRIVRVVTQHSFISQFCTDITFFLYSNATKMYQFYNKESYEVYQRRGNVFLRHDIKEARNINWV